MNDSNLPATRPAAPLAWSTATEAAGLCRRIVVATSKKIQGRNYVRVEGWQAIAIAHGCVASARDVEHVPGGIRAIGEVRRADGLVLSTAEGFVGEDEPTWAGRAEYARRAMAQTRAISRACRSAFAHVVVMMDAGLETTPAEEVPPEGFGENHHDAAAPARQAPAAPERQVETTAAPAGCIVDRDGTRWVPIPGEHVPGDYRERKADYYRQGLGCRKTDAGAWVWCRKDTGAAPEPAPAAEEHGWIDGDAKAAPATAPATDTLSKLVSAFEVLRVSQRQIEDYLGHGLEAVSGNELEALRCVYRGVRGGETWEQALEVCGPAQGKGAPMPGAADTRPDDTPATPVPTSLATGEPIHQGELLPDAPPTKVRGKKGGAA